MQTCHARGRGTSAAIAGAVALVLFGSQVAATDQGITGKKLLLKSKPKLVLLSKDPSISIAAGDPVGGADSSITFDDGGGPITWPLPASQWSANGSGTLFQYKNSDAPAGPSEVKIAKVKSGLLKVVAKGLPFPVPNGAATIHIVLKLDGGTDTYCMTFTGTGDGSKLLVKDAAAGICCEAGAPVGGYCWFTGALNASCDATCAAHSLSCDPATASFAGFPSGTLANCSAVLSALAGFPISANDGADGLGVGCGFCAFPDCFVRDTGSPTTCGASFSTAARACACR